MPTVKEELRQLIERLPDDCSLEDIQYHLYLRQKIESGLAAINEGRTLSQEAVERRMAKWLER